MLARTPWVKPVSAKPKPKKLSRKRRSDFVDAAALILKQGRPTPFAFEGLALQGFRSGLCLKGWSWTDADAAAAEIIAAALNRIGAKRPTWQQGQPEWTQAGVISLDRRRCVQCGGNLEDYQKRYCSRNCAAAARNERKRLDDKQASKAKIYAYYAEWSARQPEQPCEECNRPFRPARPGRRFCSKACANRSNSRLSEWHKERMRCG